MLIDTISDIKARLNIDDNNIAKGMEFYTKHRFEGLWNESVSNEGYMYILCMEIYKKTSIDYYTRYKDFFSDARKIISTLRGEALSNSYYELEIQDFELMVKEFIENVKFFELEDIEIEGIEFSYLEKNINVVTEKFIENEKRKKYDDFRKKEGKDDDYKNKYFKFLELGNSFYEGFGLESKKLINNLSLAPRITNKNDLIEFEKEFSLDRASKRVALIFKENKIVEVLRASSSLNFDKFNAYAYDYIIFIKIENKYANDLYVRIRMEYNLFIDAHDLSVKNNIYTGINAAKKAYKIEYGLDLRDMKKIIKEYDLDFNIKGTDFLLDKFELDKAVKKYIKRN